MKKSSERQGFVAPRPGKFQVHHPGAWQTISDPVDSTPLAPTPADQNEIEANEGADLSLSGSDQSLPAQEPQPRAAQPHAFQPLHPRRQHLRGRYRFPFRSAMLPFACLVLGAVGGYLFPKSAEKTIVFSASGYSQGDITLLTPGDQDELNAAYTARRAGKYAEAEQLFTALGRKHPNWGAMEIEVARTLLYQRALSRAHGILKAEADTGSMPADANFNLGVLDIVQKTYGEAEASFAKAVALDPSRPDFYYFWGECLRVEGKPLEAATKFRAALLRNQYETEGGLYLLNLWLSEIEADQEDSDGASAQIDAALAQPRPPMEALFAAAARDLKAGHFTAAAAQLVRARQLVEPAMFPIILKDPIFAQEHSRPELAQIFQTLTPVANAKTDEAASSPVDLPSKNEHGSTPTIQPSGLPAKTQ